ncbi:MAG: hypothetical protein ACI9F2_000514 [Lysobacterales bacterium]|jgi:hypothetical protein
MFKAELSKQLMINILDEVGSLSDVTKTLTGAEINMLALCVYEVEGNVAIMLVTDDNNGAKSLLESCDYNVVEEEVILLEVPNQTGALQVVTDKFRESDINMRLLYGSVSEDNDKSMVVIIAEDNLDAMMVIKTEIERG